MFSQLNDDMPFSFAIQNGEYGYKKSDGTFKSFRSQSDVDGAIADAMVGTAQAAQVLTGYTFTNSTASGIDGTMPNQGSKQYTINPGGQQTIPAGFHDGTGYVKANPNTNSTTYTFSSNSTGGTVDLGINNTVRYINASNVYNYGYNNGVDQGEGKATIINAAHTLIIPYNSYGVTMPSAAFSVYNYSLGDSYKITYPTATNAGYTDAISITNVKNCDYYVRNTTWYNTWNAKHLMVVGTYWNFREADFSPTGTTYATGTDGGNNGVCTVKIPDRDIRYIIEVGIGSGECIGISYYSA